MMRTYLPILFFACACVTMMAQTPYDSFAPETSRPILEIEALSQLHTRSLQSSDTVFCALVIDTSQEQIYLIDVSDDEIIAYAPITDDIRKWMSVDPLADKYPNISPYAYCGWNPINAIDPDGRDIWDLDIDGNIVKHIVTNSEDMVRYVDAKGEVRMHPETNQPMLFSTNYGMIYNISDIDGCTAFSVEGDKIGSQLFEFLAQSGINVEWSQLKTGKDESGTNYLSTSKTKFSNTSAGLIKEKYLPPQSSTLREQIHNHPGGNPEPSGRQDKIDPYTGNIIKNAGCWGDMNVKNITQGKYGASVVFKIFIPGSGRYIQY